MAPTMKRQHQGLLPTADLAEEIVRLRDELRNERDRNLHTLADFKNYRRRISGINERNGNRCIEVSI